MSCHIEVNDETLVTSERPNGVLHTRPVATWIPIVNLKPFYTFQQGFSPSYK